MSVRAFCSTVLAAGTAYFFYRNHKKTDLHAEEFTVNVEKVNLDNPARIAVIGTGIGGSSASYFLRKTFGSSVQIDAYEKDNRIGGRMRTIELNGNEVEAGGTVIHDSNKYMAYFTKEMGLQSIKIMDSSTLGIWNGNGFVFTESKYGFLTVMKMLWRYGPLSLWNLQSSLDAMLKDFVKVYDIQDGGNAYETVPDLLNAMGGETFVNYTQQTAKEIMKKNGLGERLIDELVTAVTRCNYGQDSSVNGFTGYVSMAGGTEGALWSVKGGNYLVCEKLLENAKVNIYFSKKVKNIQKKLNANGKPSYFIETDAGGNSEIAYDAVIVAAPLEVPNCYFKCNECSDWPKQATLGRYQQTIATFIQAYCNYKYFGFKNKNELPDAIFTTETQAVKFSTIGGNRNTKGELISPPVYKVFSREQLDDETIKTLFEISGETKVKAYRWLAYPHYVPPEKFSSFKLDDGVFYVNSIERAASAMEMSAVGGRNAALLTKNFLLSI